MFPVTPYPNSEYINYLNTFPTFQSKFPDLPSDSIGKVTFSFMGLLGAQIGYRYEKFRAEAEFMYNANNIDTLEINNSKLKTYQRLLKNSGNPVYVGGQINVLAGFLNFYYDMLPPPTLEDTHVVPYVGLGIGYASIQNNFHVTIDQNTVNNYIPGSTREFLPTTSAAAGQLIGGLSYYLDDFTFFSLDCRVFSTANISQGSPYTNQNIRYQIISGNLSFNGSFDFG